MLCLCNIADTQTSAANKVRQASKTFLFITPCKYAYYHIFMIPLTSPQKSHISHDLQYRSFCYFSQSCQAFFETNSNFTKMLPRFLISMQHTCKEQKYPQNVFASCMQTLYLHPSLSCKYVYHVCFICVRF